MKSKAIVFFAMLVILAIQACKTEKFYVDELAKQYFGSFKEGSYWVYEDSTGTVDSTWVVSYEQLLSIPRRLLGSVTREKGYEQVEISNLSNISGNETGYTAYAWDDCTTSCSFGKYHSVNAADGITVNFKNKQVQSKPDIVCSLLNNYQTGSFLFPNALKIERIDTGSNSVYIIVVRGIGVVEKKFSGDTSAFCIQSYLIKL